MGNTALQRGLEGLAYLDKVLFDFDGLGCISNGIAVGFRLEVGLHNKTPGQSREQVRRGHEAARTCARLDQNAGSSS